MKYFLLATITSLLASCNSKNSFPITVDSKVPQIDSIYIVESITGEILAKVPLRNGSADALGEVDYPTYGIVKIRDGTQEYLTILRPGKKLNISIASDSTLHTTDLGDSILNYLWHSNNEFIARNANFIFTSNNPDSIINIIDNFRLSRKEKIEVHSDHLHLDDKELLLYQNDARINSFLFYFGRLARNFPPTHQYFSFIQNMDNNTQWAKTLPQNLLYKHEINYLQNNDSINIESFLHYIGSQTHNKDLRDYLRAIYIREVIERPSYWKKHQKYLSEETLNRIIEQEKSNKYLDLIAKSSSSYFSSQKGVKAYNFTAETVDGSKIKLSDLKGKIVFIDSWASWCGPCIGHRPRVLELANKYKDDPRVEILMISVDASKEDWLGYLTKNNELDNPGDLIIENGMDTEYGDSFNIKQIPKYILIDQYGVIINSNISEPSIAVEAMIENALNKI